VHGIVAHQEISRRILVTGQEIKIKDCADQDHGDNAPVGLIVIARYFVRIARPVRWIAAHCLPMPLVHAIFNSILSIESILNNFVSMPFVCCCAK
jgi:hypothetical protein